MLESQQTLSSVNRWIITIILMSATLMQVIDTTIVNVALPHMQGSLGATSEEITWTLTSYLISSAIFMPLTGYFCDVLGRKNYLIISIAGFTLTSALCGAAFTLPQLIFFRLLQGIFGASLVPLSQAALTDLFPAAERGKAMAIWGIGVMIGPILGPTLGGYLTEFSSWRATFYVNIPVGLLILAFVNMIPDTVKKTRYMDWPGLILISIAIGALQFVIDRGNQHDWFNSLEICLMSYLVIFSLVLFVLQSSNSKKNAIFDIKIFKDKNFAIASILLCIFGLGLYGMMVIQPMMLEALFNYPALMTGLLIAPRGISGMISMMLVGKLINYVEPKYFIISGIIITAVGLKLCTYYSIDNINYFWIIGPSLLQGFGLGMVFVPLSSIAFLTLPMHLRTEAAGLYNLLRTIGCSMGIAFAITLYTRRTQFFWHELSSYITPYNNHVLNYLHSMHLQPQSPVGMQLLATVVYKQAAMLSYVNVFAVIMWCFILMLPLSLLLSNKNNNR